MPGVTVNGLELNYREAGQGFPVVLVHGFTGNLRNWALVAPALKDRFRTVSVDLRGHGHSAKPARPEDYTLEAMAEDVHGVIQHLGIRECFLVGHSMGGMIAQHMVLSDPERFRALVLIDTAAELLRGPRLQDRARLLEVAREHGMEAVFEEQLKTSPMAAQLRAQPHLLELYRRDFLLTCKEAYLYCAQAIANRTSLLERLSEVRVPTLVIVGENDEPFLEPSRRIHQAIPGSALAVISGAGHTPQVERSPDFNRVLTGFLEKVHQSVAAGG